MSLRFLFLALAGLAMLFAPLAMPAPVEAATPTHHQAMKAPGDCPEAPSPASHQDKHSDQGCCSAMCTAVAAGPFGNADALGYAGLAKRITSDPSPTGRIDEIATPPPRHS